MICVLCSTTGSCQSGAPVCSGLEAISDSLTHYFEDEASECINSPPDIIRTEDKFLRADCKDLMRILTSSGKVCCYKGRRSTGCVSCSIITSFFLLLFLLSYLGPSW